MPRPTCASRSSAHPALHADKRLGLRHSPIKAAVLTNGDVDHIIGLINLREAQAFSVYGTRRVLDILKSNTVFQVLAEPLVPRIALPLDQPTPLKGADTDLGLTVEAFAVPGKVALYLEDASAGKDLGSQEGDTIGLKVTDPAAKTSSSISRAALRSPSASPSASRAPRSSSSTAPSSPTTR